MDKTGSAGWRDISSAPKDGTHILLAWKWNNGTPPRVSEAFWRNDMPFSSPGVWWYFSGRMFQEPTHWMPLPDSPSLTRGEG
jgi:hypothetical protein